MADITVMPKHRDNNNWTLTKACRVGETYALARHDVRVVRIVEERPTCNLCEVQVIGPINDADPLSFAGNFERQIAPGTRA